jgi:hypothetical protein
MKKSDVVLVASEMCQLALGKVNNIEYEVVKNIITNFRFYVRYRR